MGYYLKTFIGAALYLGSVVLFNVALLKLLETGTCASGGPYVTANPCPDGTGAWAGAITGSIFGGLIGAAIFAFRGDRPGGSGESLAGGLFGWGGFAWSLFFAGSGTVALIASLTGDDMPSDSKLGGLIVAGTFLLMGLPVFVFSVKGILSNLFSRGFGGGRRDGRPMSMGEAANAAAAAASSGSSSSSVSPGSPGWAKAAPAAPVSRGGGDPLDQIERLDRLRKSGALSQSEFEREKAKILGG